MSMLADVVASGRADAAQPKAEKVPPARMIASVQHDLLADELSTMLEGTDPEEHGEDIEYIVSVAMKEFGVRLSDELMDFVNNQLARAKQSREIDEGGRHFAADPMILQLARYLRGRERVLAQHGQ